ncbi:unnamed protein product [Rotaria magnacalcarata]|uniref:Uncharacterized protein n=1 Tax=Rotaria magnacalcarata TaxID=392030 RepID=A0A820RTV8_9BILA|nr:unnamed protein product [Rotaria magnacalcarata]
MAVRRYQIREKIFSLGDNFKIKDELGQDVYTVRSKLFSVGDKLVLEDMAGKACQDSSEKPICKGRPPRDLSGHCDVCIHQRLAAPTPERS